MATSHYLNQWWLVYWRIYASLALIELTYPITYANSFFSGHLITTWRFTFCMYPHSSAFLGRAWLNRMIATAPLMSRDFHTKASNPKIWSFPCRYPEQAVERTVNLPWAEMSWCSFHVIVINTEFNGSNTVTCVCLYCAIINPTEEVYLQWDISGIMCC